MGELGEMEPIRELVYRNLRERIVAGHFDFGTRLKETDIANELGISRTPVREAFRKLELEGLVQSLSRRGVVVDYPKEDDLSEIYAVREVLEGLAARLGAVRRSETEMTSFDRYAGLMEDALRRDDMKAFAEFHKEFNVLLYQMSGKVRLIDILSRFNEYIEKSQMIAMRQFGRGEQILVEHRRIVSAIAAQDPDEAETATRFHVRMAGQAFFAARTKAVGAD